MYGVDIDKLDPSLAYSNFLLPSVRQEHTVCMTVCNVISSDNKQNRVSVSTFNKNKYIKKFFPCVLFD